MLNPICSLCVYLTEMVIAYIFFSSIFEHRIPRTKCLLVGCILFITGSLLNLFFENNPLVNFVTTIHITLLFSIVSFHARVIHYVFNTAIS